MCYKCIKPINTLIAVFCYRNIGIWQWEDCCKRVAAERIAMILLDYRDKRPIYEQVVEKLERLIASGGLEPLTKMPSVRSLAMELSVNPNTIQRAYAQLETDGYLYTVSGRGSFVTAESDWRESRQGKILEEWQAAVRKAKEAGLSQELLLEQLRRIYQEEEAER